MRKRRGALKASRILLEQERSISVLNSGIDGTLRLFQGWTVCYAYVDFAWGQPS